MKRKEVKELFDYSKLLGRLKEKSLTQEKFAELMGMSGTTLSKKLNGKSEWTQAEMNKACEILEINPEEIPVYCFKVKV